MNSDGLTIRINSERLDEMLEKTAAIKRALGEVKALWAEVSELMQLKPEMINDELFLCSREHCVPRSE